MSLVARRFALRIQPVPMIILEYVDAEGKTRLRSVKLHEARLKTDGDVDVLTSKVLASLPRNLDKTKVRRDEVKALVQQLLQWYKQDALPEPLRVESPAFEEEDLNRVSPGRLQAAKAVMNKTFERNARRPGDEGFVWDVQKDFAPPVVESDWD